MHELAKSYHYNTLTKKLTLEEARCFTCDELFELTRGEPIEILQIDGGTCHSLPSDFYRLDPKAVFFNRLPFSYVPPVLSACDNLGQTSFKFCQTKEIPEDALPLSTRWAIFTGNENLRRLPASIGKLTALRKFGLAGCALSELPEEMRNCTELELFRISANNFVSRAPSWLFTLPHLAWYGDASNPFCAIKCPPSVHEIASERVVFEVGADGEKVRAGESPSSQVFKGILDRATPVAVKLYNEPLTSDGQARADIEACLAVQGHSKIIEAQGMLKGLPEEKNGLVLSHTPPGYRPLGLVPNAETITRDNFADVTFSLLVAMNIFRDITSACQYIHAHKEYAHGDLYAHNIFSNKEGSSILGDFGAASPYDRSEDNIREKLDVLAFGHLIEDISTRLAFDDMRDHAETIRDLWSIHAACTNRNVRERPAFNDIGALLEATASYCQ